ncbi:MAG TPA: hypothetical protein DEB73_02185 [Candidatus Magasanikbacteria bacterium]|uniref:Uncharacterized protein n=1 Tax=Candidatus Magasanikbacteria bacterium GW2011_GWC2_41_17 TaxID=1619048 RepID=A0A0G0VBW4_9BACT|nr:MAG: hypothetical protein UU49_C0017G0007 [Candidatus Magasanikbacteria bacterium GW2011_GWC2_41_17]HBV58049.1 hypothetical protein [Candidatus Magasanikbacteria bacterium]HBX16449.1 hypothetical protein [Candidatus Magasanikbacteria bacterium]
MKRLAEDEEAVVRIEIVVEPVQIQIALVAVPVEISHIPVATGVTPLVLCRISSLTPPIEYSQG